MRVAAIVLAAGASRRMGRAKQTLPYGQSTILETVIRALNAASRVEGVTVVLGSNWPEVYPALEHLDAEVFVNPRPEDGMISSAQWALAQVRNDADAFLFALGDQPQIETRVVDALIEAAAQSGKGICLPTYAGKRGHPVLFRARYKPEILSLPLTVGLNHLVHSHPDDVLEVPVDTSSVLKDIDTPEDYRRALEEKRSGEAGR